MGQGNEREKKSKFLFFHNRALMRNWGGKRKENKSNGKNMGRGGWVRGGVCQSGRAPGRRHGGGGLG